MKRNKTLNSNLFNKEHLNLMNIKNRNKSLIIQIQSANLELKEMRNQLTKDHRATLNYKKKIQQLKDLNKHLLKKLENQLGIKPHL